MFTIRDVSGAAAPQPQTSLRQSAAAAEKSAAALRRRNAAAAAVCGENSKLRCSCGGLRRKLTFRVTLRRLAAELCNLISHV